MECYLDNSATTKLCDSAKNEMQSMLNDNYGNPSSLHKKGDEAKRALETARSRVANALSCEPEEIFFTSGGTESNNIAIFGAVEALKRRGRRIVTTTIEHPSVLEPIKRLENQGFEVIRLPVDKEGRINKKDLFNAVNKNTILVSIMLVNNEVGSIQPVKAARSAVKRAGAPALIHSDCVQAFGKLDISPDELGVDLLTVSSHKVHGPKGAGALYIRKGVRIVSPVYGGGQEGNIRSGTQPMPAIVGMGAAVNEFPNLEKLVYNTYRLRDYFLSKVSQINGIVINSSRESLPFIINLSVMGIPSEVMRNALSANEIYVSSGSACSKGHRSRVLTNMGLPNEVIDSALRISLSRFTTKEELDLLAYQIQEARNSIRSV